MTSHAAFPPKAASTLLAALDAAPPLRAEIVPVTPFRQNCALIWSPETKEGAVIDPGGDVPAIRAAIARNGVRVARIVLTHGHIDHAGGATELQEALGGSAAVPIIGPDRRDQFLLDGLEGQAPTFNMPEVRNVRPDQWLTEGDTVPIAGLDFAVLHCPGHTPGHIVLVQDELRFAIVGDVLFRGSVGRTDFAYGDGAALIAGIRTKLFPLGDDISFICGHGPGSTFGAERAGNPFAGDGARG